MSQTALPAIDLFEAIYTARAQRRLRPDPVPEKLITRVLDAAIRASSAGNAQNWHFVVIRDAEQRRRVGALYRKASDIAEAVYQARSHPSHLTEAQWQRMMTSGEHLWNHMGDAPVLLVPCLHQRDLPARDALDPAWHEHYDSERAYLNRIRGASIYPAVQNVILACRAFGLGTVITTASSADRSRIQGAAWHSQRCRYVRIDAHWMAGRKRFGPLSRRPLEEVLHIDQLVKPRAWRKEATLAEIGFATTSVRSIHGPWLARRHSQGACHDLPRTSVPFTHTCRGYRGRPICRPLSWLVSTFERIEQLRNPNCAPSSSVNAANARLAAEAADKANRAGHAARSAARNSIAIKDLVEIEGEVAMGGSAAWRNRIAITALQR